MKLLFFPPSVCTCAKPPSETAAALVSFPPLFCLATLTNLRPFVQRFICCCSRPPVTKVVCTWKSRSFLAPTPARESDPKSQPCSSQSSSGEQTGMEEKEKRQTRDERMIWQPWMGPTPPPPPTLPGLRAKKKKKKPGQRREPTDS